MKAMITADWHLTSRPIDDYRWDLFPWLARQCENRGVSHLFIAGDIADLKDNHPASFVNRLVIELRKLAKLVSIHVIPGNHDYIDPANPFFRFLQWMDGVEFYIKPTSANFGGAKVLFLPHTKRWRSSWGLTRHAKSVLKGHDLILLHQPFKGAEMESGQVLEDGLSTEVFLPEKVGKRCVVVAGDIHVPQRVGNVTYTGAPYPIHFGDAFRPRVLLWEPGGKLTSLNRSSLRKAMVTGTGPECLDGLTSGDMARVKLHLARSEFVDWQKRRREIETRAEELGVVLCGVEVKEAAPGPQRVRVGEESVGDEVENPADRVGTFLRFCRAHGIKGDLLKQGLGVVK